jgi:hypothetical protein
MEIHKIFSELDVSYSIQVVKNRLNICVVGSFLL